MLIGGAWRKTPEGKVQRRKSLLKVRYGMTPDDHQMLYIFQNGKCAICKQHIDYNKVCTDHDHKTGKVRGLLCQRCNIWMAAVDDKEFMKNAKTYLG